MKFTDQEILERIRTGDDNKVLAYLYQKQWPPIKRYIMKNSGTEEEAQDVFQDAILAFYKQVKLNKFKEGYEIGGFIFSVGRNFWINKVKKDQKQTKLTEEQQLMVGTDDNIWNLFRTKLWCWRHEW